MSRIFVLSWKSLSSASRFLIIGLLLFSITALAPRPCAASESEVERLKHVQDRVQQVVKDKMNVVVAVTDGIGYGSGVIVSADGLVLTAGHVLTTGGRDFRVIFPDGREAKAKPLGKNLNVDAGMVQIIEPGTWTFAEPGDMESLNRGDWCICLGHSGGYELGRKPPVRAGRIVKFEPDQIVTDCALIGGDSGGPLFDLDGRVIGIHSSIGSSIAENRHVSIGTFHKHWQRMSNGESWGVLPELADREINKASMGIRVDRNAQQANIKLVHQGGAAQMAGLRPGDVVTTFDHIAVKNAQHLIDLIAQRRSGETVTVEISRGTETISVDVVLGQQ